MKHFHSICVILFAVATSLCTTKTVDMYPEVTHQQPKNCVLISQSYKDGSSVIIDNKRGYLYVSVDHGPIIIQKGTLQIILTTEDFEKMSEIAHLKHLNKLAKTIQPTDKKEKIKLSNIINKRKEKIKQIEILIEKYSIIKHLKETY